MFLRFAPFLKTIEYNHPYLAEKTLQEHIEQKTLYIVNLTEVAIGETTVCTCLHFIMQMLPNYDTILI